MHLNPFQPLPIDPSRIDTAALAQFGQTFSRRDDSPLLLPDQRNETIMAARVFGHRPDVRGFNTGDLHHRRDDVAFDGVQNAVTLGGDLYQDALQCVLRSSGVSKFLLLSELVRAGRGITLGTTPSNGDILSVDYWSPNPVGGTTILGAPDPYFKFNAALLHFNDANGSTTFTDQMVAAWTGSGGAAISTAQSKYGGSSLLVATASSQYISTAASSTYDFGSGDFTIEYWVRPNSLSATIQAITGNRQQTSNGGFLSTLTSTNTSAVFFDASSSSANPLSAAPTINAWNHIAICRFGNQWTSYTNGVGGTPITSTLTVAAGSTLYIGRDPVVGTPRYADSYIDDFRITKGKARYTSNFTPQAYQFQDA